VVPKEMRRVLLCSGQVYYDLLEKRQNEKINVGFLNFFNSNGIVYKLL